MNRPRLPFVKGYFNQLINQGNNESIELLKEYSQIKQEQGEFLAGRFLIEVYLETQLNIQELQNAKEKATIYSHKRLLYVV